MKRAVRATIPLRVRQLLATAVARVPSSSRQWWIYELLRDMAENDPNGFHRFLWSHHLGYAESYSAAARFGEHQVHPTREIFFAELRGVLDRVGLPAERVTSVFEVGCSLGYLLRHLETTLFPRATTLEGNDIDGRAVAEGQQYLGSVGSRVKLHQADMAELATIFGGRQFDVVFAAGVLMYLKEEQATAVVRTLLGHTTGVLAIAALADPERDNRELERSVVRERDLSFIHNVDRMIEQAGGRVVARRWDGARQLAGNTIYFVFAQPARSA